MRLMKGVLTAFAAAASLAVAAAQTPSPTATQANRPPTVVFKVPGRVILAGACPEDGRSGDLCDGTDPKVQLTADASDPDGDRLLYTYLTTGGTLSGVGPKTTLDLTGFAPGTYAVTVEVSDGRGGTASDTARITVERCTCPQIIDPPRCPTVAVSCPDTPWNDGRITSTASVAGGDPDVTPTYNWTVSAGTISDGQGTSSITVDYSKVGYTTFTATVDVGGYDRSCRTSASCTTNIEPPMRPRKFDEYGIIATGDEKQRLDAFAVELQNDPTAQGYVLCYGGRRGRAGESRRRCERARTYLVSTRGIEAPRVVTQDGGLRDVLTLELWFVPSGAQPPQPTPTFFPNGRDRR